MSGGSQEPRIPTLSQTRPVPPLSPPPGVGLGVWCGDRIHDLELWRDFLASCRLCR